MGKSVGFYPVRYAWTWKGTLTEKGSAPYVYVVRIFSGMWISAQSVISGVGLRVETVRFIHGFVTGCTEIASCRTVSTTLFLVFLNCHEKSTLGLLDDVRGMKVSNFVWIWAAGSCEQNGNMCNQSKTVFRYFPALLYIVRWSFCKHGIS